jgi:hypothetical protein
MVLERCIKDLKQLVSTCGPAFFFLFTFSSRLALPRGSAAAFSTCMGGPPRRYRAKDPPASSGRREPQVIIVTQLRCRSSSPPRLHTTSRHYWMPFRASSFAFSGLVLYCDGESNPAFECSNQAINTDAYSLPRATLKQCRTRKLSYPTCESSAPRQCVAVSLIHGSANVPTHSSTSLLKTKISGTSSPSFK